MGFGRKTLVNVESQPIFCKPKLEAKPQAFLLRVFLLSETEYITAFEWRAKDTKAILNSIEMAIRVLEDRVAKAAYP